MAISDEMREQLEMVVQYGDQVKAMFKEQDDVDYEISDYDEPITQLLGHMNEVMEGIDGGWS
jgi:FtsZ-binding cell division protein ZapB